VIDVSLAVTTADGQNWTITPTVGTYVRFERHFDCSVSQMADGMRMEHLAFLAWEASRHQGHKVPDFDAFVDQITELQVVNNDRPLAEPA